jgi:hypothetical protein
MAVGETDHGLFQDTILTFSSMSRRQPWKNMKNLSQDGKSPGTSKTGVTFITSTQ